MLRRLSVLGALFLAACATTHVPQLQPSGYYNKVATKAETADWRSARRADTTAAYRDFLNKYPKSRYAPEAIARMKVLVTRNPTTVRNVSGAGASRSGTGGGRSY